MKKLNIALVGLGFGECFIDIYKNHPNVNEIGICDINHDALKKFAESYGIKKTYNSFEEVLADKNLDAVHLMTPIPLHAEQTIQVLESGKHCACTVPMATSLEDIKRITEAVRKSGKNYMMMETTLYSYQHFYVKHMIESGELGKIQFMRGSHYQDMQRWQDYWMGLPPMYYGTHAIAPMVGLSNSRIKRVVCFGSGTMAEWLHKQYNNPFPIESALFEFENGVKGEATRSLFETARQYQESFSVYGSKKTFEWGAYANDKPCVSTLIIEDKPQQRIYGYDTKVEPIELPNYHQSLPKEIQRFTVGGNYDPSNPEKSLSKGAGGGHEGSHPHLVHEFIMSILENRKPWIDEKLGGNITAAGICAHKSAMNNGEAVIVPEF